jgi:hypothetical protein
LNQKREGEGEVAQSKRPKKSQHLIPKKHVSDTSHQINSSYEEKKVDET